MRLIDAESFKAQLIYLANHMKDNGHTAYASALGEVISILDRRQTIDVSPKWISVKDRLPESGVHVFVCCENPGSLGSKIRYICDGFYAGKYKVKADWYDDDSAVEYSEEDDEYYFEEGWYEVIKNWGDYNSVVIDDCPTHWMPLPKPPKEEG